MKKVILLTAKSLFSEQKLQEIQANYQKIHIHNGSDNIAHFLADLAKDTNCETN